MIKKLASHLGEYRRAAILTPMFSALEAVMDILLPTIMAFIIDLGIEKGDMNAIVKYGLLTFAVAAIALLLGVLAGKYAAEASTGFAGNLRDAMYENIQHYSFSNIDKFSTAGLVTRMTTDVTNLQEQACLHIGQRADHDADEHEDAVRQIVLEHLCHDALEQLARVLDLRTRASHAAGAGAMDDFCFLFCHYCSPPCLSKSPPP